MADMGLMGMGGAAGAGDAMQVIFDQRMRAAQAAQAGELAKRQLDQQDALTRLKFAEQAEATRARVEATQQAAADRKEAARQLNLVRMDAQLKEIPTEQDLSPSTMKSYTDAGVAPERFAPKPITPMAPPAAIAAPGAEQPTPGTVENSPAPPQQLFHRIPTAQELTHQHDEADKTAYQNELAAIRQQLADQAGSKEQPNSFQLQPEIDPATGKQTGRFLGYNTKKNRWEPVQGNGPAATKAPAGRQLPYQAADNMASLNTAEVEGVKVLRLLKGSGLDRSNDPADPRWQKFVVTELKIAPENYTKADLQQRTAFVNAAMMRRLMGGRPNEYIARLIQDHLPSGNMTGQQLAHVMSDVLEQAGELRKETSNMLPGVKGPISGQSYQDYLTELASGGAASAQNALDILNARRSGRGAKP